ncbi:MAG: phosphoribosylanthranilate isomerase [Actinomycetota bacterium]|nr:phosphoribosylanthranilate isomerase [Actinomycetota bacterium]
MLTQIYGLTTVADARDVDRLGPDHVGVVVDEGKDAWDSVDEVTAVAIAGAVENARVVALSLSTEPERIRATTALLSPAVLHLARAHQMRSETLARVRDQVAPSELMLTVPVVGEETLVVASRLAMVADYLLLDSSHPTTGVVGATGLTHDWSVSARIADQVACPVVLAGGLGPENVSEAIHRVRPDGVDSETRTSRDDDRRRKDLEKVEAFIWHARRAGVSY